MRGEPCVPGHTDRSMHTVSTGHRFARKLRRLATNDAQGRLVRDDINPRGQSWTGHVKQARTLGLRKRIFSEIVFQRGRTRRMPCAARQCLEQPG